VALYEVKTTEQHFVPEFAAFPLWVNVLVFIAAAAAIWMAGVRLASYAEEVARRTGLGQAFVGALLLGGVTSLPEAGTTISASALGNAPLAINNIFGGIALQVAVLAIADWVVRGRALSSRITDDTALLQAPLLVVVLAIAVAGVLLPDVVWFGVGAWSSAVLGAAIVSFYLIHRHGVPGRWHPRSGNRVGEQSHQSPERPPAEVDEAASEITHRALAAALTAAAAVILVAGWALASSADVLAAQTGLGSSFVGAVGVAIATSLPEITTTLAAVRLGAYTLAYANIFGANILDAAIIFLADVVYPGPAVLNEVGRSAAIAGLLGIALTTILMVGMVRRRRQVVVGMGIDSVVVLAVYLGGVGLLYGLR
jgi:cation:H+ antiporter